jgi:hypothetical protein
MKFRLLISGLAASALLSGCASDRHGLVLDAVGPLPAPLGAPSCNGTLVVFSAFEQGEDLNAPDYRRQHTNYRILSADGKAIQTVHNDSGTLAEGPKPVELPAGTYRVVARANGYGEVTVPVVIRANQATTVHLEGGFSWPKRKDLATSDAVRLPDGEIVGWHTAVDALPKASTPSATTAAVGAPP